MCCTDVSCWYLQVFLGPQSMNKTRSCFLCAWTLAKKRDKGTTKRGHMQTLHTKGPKRTLRYCAKSCTFVPENGVIKTK